MGTVALISLILISFTVLYWMAPKANIPRWWLFGGWFVKILFSFFYLYVFTTYYGEGERIQGDALHFMTDSKVLNRCAKEDPSLYLQLLVGLKSDDPEVLNGVLSDTEIWDYGDNGDWMNDNRLMIRLNSLVHFFSEGKVSVHVLFFSFMSMLGLIMIYKAFENWCYQKRLYFLLLMVFPSIAFFGSGLTKESIMIFGLGLFFLGLMRAIDQKLTWRNLVLFSIGISILLVNKPYAGLVLLCFMPLLLMGKKFTWQKNFLYLNSVLIILIAVALSYAPDKINLVEKVSYKQHDIANLAKGGVFFVTDSSFCQFNYDYWEYFDSIGNNKIMVNTDAEGEYKLFGQEEFHPFTMPASDSIYEIYLINEPSESFFKTTPIAYKGINLVKTIPEALFNTLVRPFPNDPGGSLKYGVFIQNTSLLIFAVIVFFYRRKLTSTETYLVYTLLVSALILLILVGWTTPVFGAIVRYKVPADIFILTALLIIFQPRNSTS